MSAYQFSEVAARIQALPPSQATQLLQTFVAIVEAHAVAQAVARGVVWGALDDPRSSSSRPETRLTHSPAATAVGAF